MPIQRPAVPRGTNVIAAEISNIAFARPEKSAPLVSRATHLSEKQDGRIRRATPSARGAADHRLRKWS